MILLNKMINILFLIINAFGLFYFLNLSLGNIVHNRKSQLIYIFTVIVIFASQICMLITVEGNSKKGIYLLLSIIWLFSVVYNIYVYIQMKNK